MLKSLFSSCSMFGNLLDQRKFVDRLRVVRDRAVGIDRDRHRAHAQKAESHQAERKHRRGDHQLPSPSVADQDSRWTSATPSSAPGNTRRNCRPRSRTRIPSDAPPSCAELTTSRTWRDSVEVKTFTSSGITAPASVPQEMMVASFHHCDVSPPRSGMMTVGDQRRSEPMETIEVIQTSEVSGDFEIHFVDIAEPRLGDGAVDEVGDRARRPAWRCASRRSRPAIAPARRDSFTPSKINVISATPVTP